MKHFRYSVLLGILFFFIPVFPAYAAPSISNVTAVNQIPKYEKFEITFDVQTNATNLQMPYDPKIDPASSVYDSNYAKGVSTNNPNYNGVTVNAIFKDPDGKEFLQPAFYYQEFDDQTKGGKEWFYPTGNFSWKVRFSPDKPGNWQFKLQAQDKENYPSWAETNWQSVTVTDSTNKGFIKVSPTDSRYFEYENGDYFPALGYNMNYSHINWDDPLIKNQANFQAMGNNGIQLVRMWLSQWGIFGSAWSDWQSPLPEQHAQYIGEQALSTNPYFGDNEVGMRLEWRWKAGMFLGFGKRSSAIKRNTNYKVFVEYLIPGVFAGPRISGYEYGLTVKLGGWLTLNATDWTDKIKGYTDPCAIQSWPGFTDANGNLLQRESFQQCTEIATHAITSSQDANGNWQWSTMEGSFNSGNRDFMENFYITLDNINGWQSSTEGNPAAAYIKSVEVREDLGNGQYGPNILYKPDTNHHQYFAQRNSYSFDKVIDLAKQNGVYVRPVILEKNEWIFNSILDDGSFGTGSNGLFYGWRSIKKIRWLQRAWWRYLQARWGYSPNVHSWELLNEGDPYHGGHYRLADEFGIFMHCEVFGISADTDNDGAREDGDTCDYKNTENHPNDHLVSTSHWHSFPVDLVWADLETKYAGQAFANGSAILNLFKNIDFSDVHKYVSDITSGNTSVRIDVLNLTSQTPYQTSQSNFNYVASDYYDATLATQKLSQTIGAKAPKGARKPVIRGEVGFGDDVIVDSQSHGGVWLHNFIWGGINPGGLIESYWDEQKHIYTASFDRRSNFKPYYDFISTVPLSNGNYEDSAVTPANPNLRVLGQKDVTNGNAHIWIQNKNHTWKNVVDGVVIQPITETISIGGFSQSLTSVTLEKWDTYTGVVDPQPNYPVTNGSISIPVTNLTTDLAVKIINPTAPTPTPTAQCFDYQISLDSDQQGGGIVSSATGKAAVRLNPSTNMLSYNILFSGLSSGETAAHIHGMAARAVDAGPLHTLSAGSPKISSWTYSDSQEQDILNGLTYVNIHTQTYPGGEIRGQVDNQSGNSKTTVDCASPLPTPTSAVPGDTNNDGSVNILDLSLLLSNFGLTVTPNTNGDVDGDGVVNLSDLAVLLSNFGR